MRATRAWEGFAQRWSSLESGASYVGDVPGIALPVIVVGHDHDDAGRTFTWAKRFTPLAGTTALIDFQGISPLWVLGLRVWGFPAATDVWLSEEEYETGFTGAVSGQIPKGGPLRFVFTSSAVGPSFAYLCPRDEWTMFPPPGLLIGPPGFAHDRSDGLGLRLHADQNGDAFAAALIYREAA